MTGIHPFRDLLKKLPHPILDFFSSMRSNLKEIFFNINKFTLIPIIIKLLLDIFGIHLPLTYNIILRLSLGIISILFSNLLELIETEKCTKDSSTKDIIKREIYISYIKYAGAYILPVIIIFLLDFIGIGELIMVGEHTPLIGHFIQLFIWTIGYSFSSWIVKKANFGSKCSTDLTKRKRNIGILSIIFVIGYEGYHAFI
jgi:hypothetical protein